MAEIDGVWRPYRIALPTPVQWVGADEPPDRSPMPPTRTFWALHDTPRNRYIVELPKAPGRRIQLAPEVVRRLMKDEDVCELRAVYELARFTLRRATPPTPAPQEKP